MKSVLAFFRLTRWKNLLIVALTQFMVWYFVIYRAAELKNTTLFLSSFNFAILSLSTVLIAAAGYIINDFFDVKIDLINKPEKVIIGNVISRKSAFMIYIILNMLGLLLGLYLAFQLQQLYLIGFQLSCIVLLWLYSAKFKRAFVSGNVMVSFLVAFTILILAAFEPGLYSFAQYELVVNINHQEQINPLGVIVVYGYFAFVITWMREVVKDLEDFEGDREEGCVTMPIKIGLKKTIGFVRLLGCLGVLPLIWIGIKLLANDWFVLSAYIFIALAFPILYLLFYLNKDKSKQHFKKLSKVLKLLMLAGILTLVIYSVL